MCFPFIASFCSPHDFWWAINQGAQSGVSDEDSCWVKRPHLYLNDIISPNRTGRDQSHCCQPSENKRSPSLWAQPTRFGILRETRLKLCDCLYVYGTECVCGTISYALSVKSVVCLTTSLQELFADILSYSAESLWLPQILLRKWMGIIDGKVCASRNRRG